MSVEADASKKRLPWLALLPLALFLGLAGVFLFQLLSGRDASVVPSALIGATAPQTSLPPLEGSPLPGIESAAFDGKLTLVNVWASWCAPCRQEHPLLMDLAEDENLVIAGLNYKDRPQQARGFLAELGNPYDAIGVDGSGRTAIDWGVYGVPETFLVGPDGTILYKHVGPFTTQSMRDGLMPAIQRARGG
ncbi:MAG: DsbE family thiol:disulfide interchange protein [Aliihoeflea sp.]|uniref:DsbE family thiol:disulfide interchange protein n=1 Tax=Aliihoeflea sp. TaxID=2608088 RepID=UPI004034D440